MTADLLEEPVWRRRAAAHEERVDAFVVPHLARRAARESHPVHDFLFTYYSQRPAQLRRWHPGHGVRLAGAGERATWKGYTVVDAKGSVGVSAAHVVAQRPLLEALHRLLVATAARPPQFGCFGLHEWAMVYRQGAEDVRHASWPLRLGSAGTDRVVESHRLACSHFDAVRFFTEPARELNLLSPTAADRPDFEQPGCLHAGMDLYRHAFRLSPMVDSGLVADCFELARDIRELDMRASPYDLSGLGYEPVAIETPEGKQAYALAQREFAGRAAPLRTRLIRACEHLLAVADGVGTSAAAPVAAAGSRP